MGPCQPLEEQCMFERRITHHPSLRRHRCRPPLKPRKRTRNHPLRGVVTKDSSVISVNDEIAHSSVPDETISALAQLASDPVLGHPGPPDHLATVEDCLALCDLGTVITRTCAHCLYDATLAAGIASSDARCGTRGCRGCTASTTFRSPC